MRKNNREFDEMRKINIEPNYLKYAEGSCLFQIGNTKVICSASIEDNVPMFLKGQGVGWITSEYSLLPRSCKTRVPRESTKGKKTGRTYEIQRLIGRSLRSVVNMSLLGERTIFLDCDVLQADGGTRCASISGSFIALWFAMSRLKEEGKIKKMPIKNFLGAISVGIINKEICLDLDYNEDSIAQVDMNIVMADNKKIIEIQGTAEKKPFTREQMDIMLDLSTNAINTIIEKQREIVERNEE